MFLFREISYPTLAIYCLNLRNKSASEIDEKW